MESRREPPFSCTSSEASLKKPGHAATPSLALFRPSFLERNSSNTRPPTPQSLLTRLDSAAYDLYTAKGGVQPYSLSQATTAVSWSIAEGGRGRWEIVAVWSLVDSGIGVGLVSDYVGEERSREGIGERHNVLCGRWYRHFFLSASERWVEGKVWAAVLKVSDSVELETSSFASLYASSAVFVCKSSSSRLVLFEVSAPDLVCFC